ncbi:hypothetical protein SHL15_0114 [Streptomyces hygroscopicus subsp. limoneus]|nr:hypothetical protein SHL15_0114 [Streptomyces hygroscopicus subsp. limoneus]
MGGERYPPVLLRIHHARLLHLLPRAVPLGDEGQWFSTRVGREGARVGELFGRRRGRAAPT